MTKPSYALWRRELKNPTPEDQRHQRENALEAMCGRWRIEAARTKPDYPVAIFERTDDAGGITVMIGMKVLNDVEIEEFRHGSWLHCIAVTEADYDAAIATGKWPGDEKPARQFTAAEKAGLDPIPDTAPEQGGNNPVDDEGKPIDLFHKQVAEKITAQLDAIKALPFPFKTMEDATAAAAIVDVLRAVGAQGEAKRKEEKKPFDDAAALVQAKWVPFLEPASQAIKRLVAQIEGFKAAETARLRREAEAAEQAERERIAEAARKEAEQAGQVVDEAEVQARVEEQIAAAPATTPPPVVVRGTASGRAVSGTKKKVGIIVDRAKFIAALDGQPDFDEWLKEKANKLARADVVLAGMRIEKQ